MNKTEKTYTLIDNNAIKYFKSNISENSISNQYIKYLKRLLQNEYFIPNMDCVSIYPLYPVSLFHFVTASLSL